MSSRYLEITYRHGKPVAAYFYLPRRPGDISARTVPSDSGLLTDYAADGRAVGIEITSPSRFTFTALNEALVAAGQQPATPDDVAPLITEAQRSAAAE